MEKVEVGQKVRLKADEPTYHGIRAGDVVEVASLETYGFSARRKDGTVVTGCGWSAWEPAYLDTHEVTCSTDERVIITTPVTGWYELPGLNKRIYLEGGQQLIRTNEKPPANGAVRRRKSA